MEISVWVWKEMTVYCGFPMEKVSNTFWFQFKKQLPVLLTLEVVCGANVKQRGRKTKTSTQYEDDKK